MNRSNETLFHIFLNSVSWCEILFHYFLIGWATLFNSQSHAGLPDYFSFTWCRLTELLMKKKSEENQKLKTQRQTHTHTQIVCVCVFKLKHRLLEARTHFKSCLQFSSSSSSLRLWSKHHLVYWSHKILTCKLHNTQVTFSIFLWRHTRHHVVL